MNKEDTLEYKLAKIKRDAAQVCKKTNKHKWGAATWVTDLEPAQYDREGDRISEARSTCGYERVCLVCGVTDYTENVDLWKAEYGLGHFECDPLTGSTRFVEHAKSGLKTATNSSTTPASKQASAD
jgi:hypothetical protein